MKKKVNKGKLLELLEDMISNIKTNEAREGAVEFKHMNDNEYEVNHTIVVTI